MCDHLLRVQDGHTVLDIARQCGQADIVRLLSVRFLYPTCTYPDHMHHAISLCDFPFHNIQYYLCVHCATANHCRYCYFISYSRSLALHIRALCVWYRTAGIDASQATRMKRTKASANAPSSVRGSRTRENSEAHISFHVFLPVFKIYILFDSTTVGSALSG